MERKKLTQLIIFINLQDKTTSENSYQIYKINVCMSVIRIGYLRDESIIRTVK